MLTQALIREFKTQVGEKSVFSDPTDLITYSYDAAPLQPVMPQLVVRPTTSTALSRAVRLCNQNGLPLTVRGAGTNLSGGTVPLPGGVVIVTNGLSRIVEINSEDMVAVVEPGVVTAKFAAAAQAKGLFYPPDPGSQAVSTLVRGTVIGFWLGILPGGGAVLSSFVAYAVEKRFSKHPEKFGTGLIEGVASPEAANNAAAQSAFIPLLTLGLPANVVMALLLGALILHGVTPGPLLMTQNPDIFWGVIASMYLGNIMLLVLNLPLIGLWVQLLRIPYPYLMPLIIIFCILGAYSVANSLADVLFMFLFGIVGYIMKKLKFDSPPLVLAFVLGPLVEYYFKSALMFSRGSFTVFFTRPISLVCLSIAAAILAWSIISGLRRKSKIIPRES